MTPFDKIETSQSIRDVEVAMARYRMLVAVHFTRMQATIAESQDALSKSRALLGRTRGGAVGETGWHGVLPSMPPLTPPRVDIDG